MLYAPFEWWSLFVNVLSWPLIGVMFAAEWLVRRVAFPEFAAAHSAGYRGENSCLPAAGGTDADGSRIG